MKVQTKATLSHPLEEPERTVIEVLDDGADYGSLESFPQKPESTVIEVLDEGTG